MTATTEFRTSKNADLRCYEESTQRHKITQYDLNGIVRYTESPKCKEELFELWICLHQAINVMAFRNHHKPLLSFFQK